MFRVTEGTCLSSNDQPFKGIMVTYGPSENYTDPITLLGAFCVDPRDFDGTNDPDH